MNPDREKRKSDHFSICAEDRARFRAKTTLLEQVELIHRALPGIDLDEIDTSIEFCQKKLAAPLWISAMTGGWDEAARFNRDMAGLAEEIGVGFCLGSMKAMLDNPARRLDFEVRDVAPTTLVMGNLGCVDMARSGPGPVIEALDRIKADGLTIHLNPAMELIQPEGDTKFKGAIEAIVALVQKAPCLPVVVKETGCGLSYLDGQELYDAGIRCVETGGAGGTSWVGVEALRADGQKSRLGEVLWDWGVPTAASTAWLAGQRFEVVASGGIRSGLDIAAALALGAKLAGVAAPLVQAYRQGGAAKAKDLIEEMIAGLRYAMLLCGSKRPEDLARAPRVIGPDLERWIAAARTGG